MIKVYRKYQTSYLSYKIDDGVWTPKLKRFVYEEKIFEFERNVPRWLMFQAHRVVNEATKTVLKDRTLNFEYGNGICSHGKEKEKR